MEGSHEEGECPSSAAVLVFSTSQSAPSASSVYFFVCLHSTCSARPAATPIDESGVVGVGGGPPGQERIDAGTSTPGASYSILVTCAFNWACLHGTGLLSWASLCFCFLGASVCRHSELSVTCTQWDRRWPPTSNDTDPRGAPLVRASSRSIIALTFPPSFLRRAKYSTIQSQIHAVTMSPLGCSPPIISAYFHSCRDHNPRPCWAFPAKGEPLHLGGCIHRRLSMVAH